MLLEMAILHSFLLLSNLYTQQYHTSLFVHLLMDTSCFNVFPIVNSATVNMRNCIIFLNFSKWRVTFAVPFSSVTLSCPTLYDPMSHSTPGLPVHHQLPEFTQTHVHRVLIISILFTGVISHQLIYQFLFLSILPSGSPKFLISIWPIAL